MIPHRAAAAEGPPIRSRGSTTLSEEATYHYGRVSGQMRRRRTLRCRGGRGAYAIARHHPGELLMQVRLVALQATGFWSMLDWGCSMLFRCILDGACHSTPTGQVCPRLQVSSPNCIPVPGASHYIVLSLGSLLVMFG